MEDFLPRLAGIAKRGALFSLRRFGLGRGRGGFVWHGRVFFHVAGDDPFGQLGGIVFIFQAHDGVQHLQGHGGAVFAVGQGAGGAALRALAAALGGDGVFKVGDVVAEVGEEVRVQLQPDHGGAVGCGIRLKSAGGVEQGLIAAAAGQMKFAFQPGRAEEHERMGGIGDGQKVSVQLVIGDALGDDAGMVLPAAGDLAGSLAAGAGNQAVDDGELLPTGAGGREIGGVFGAEAIHGFTGGEQMVLMLVHTVSFSFLWLWLNCFLSPNKRK